MTSSLIALSGIERIFLLGDSEVHALRTLDLSIAAGEYVAVMGPSGSGKSTLLNLLGLLDRPNAGTYRLEGRDVTTLSPEEQARVRSERIGFVFQSFHLVPRLTAAENIALPMTLAGIAPAERAARVEQQLAFPTPHIQHRRCSSQAAIPQDLITKMRINRVAIPMRAMSQKRIALAIHTCLLPLRVPRTGIGSDTPHPDVSILHLRSMILQHQWPHRHFLSPRRGTRRPLHFHIMLN